MSEAARTYASYPADIILQLAADKREKDVEIAELRHEVACLRAELAEIREYASRPWPPEDQAEALDDIKHFARIALGDLEPPA